MIRFSEVPSFSCTRTRRSSHLQPATVMFSIRASFLVRSSGFQKRRFASAASSGFRIPVINFSKFRTAQSDTEKKDTANDIVSAFKSSGFIYVSNHGIPEGAMSFTILKSACLLLLTNLDTISNVFRKVASFLCLTLNNTLSYDLERRVL